MVRIEEPVQTEEFGVQGPNGGVHQSAGVVDAETAETAAAEASRKGSDGYAAVRRLVSAWEPVS